MGLNGVVDNLFKVLGAPVASCKPHQRKGRWEESAVCQVVNRWH